MKPYPPFPPTPTQSQPQSHHLSIMFTQVLEYVFTWLGRKYLWHIPQREAEYSADSLQPKEITFPDLEKQAQQKNMMNLETASESFKHRFLDAHRSSCLI
jgi:hypothetical protein